VTYGVVVNVGACEKVVLGAKTPTMQRAVAYPAHPHNEEAWGGHKWEELTGPVDEAKCLTLIYGNQVRWVGVGGEWYPNIHKLSLAFIHYLTISVFRSLDLSLLLVVSSLLSLSRFFLVPGLRSNGLLG
jgi:hypothetical protein